MWLAFIATYVHCTGGRSQDNEVLHTRQAGWQFPEALHTARTVRSAAHVNSFTLTSHTIITSAAVNIITSSNSHVPSKPVDLLSKYSNGILDQVFSARSHSWHQLVSYRYHWTSSLSVHLIITTGQWLNYSTKGGGSPHNLTPATGSCKNRFYKSQETFTFEVNLLIYFHKFSAVS